MFFRRKTPAPELTNEAYARWLRAQRPPFAMFLGMSELEQEALARLGDESLQDFAVAIGYAVADPRAADAGISAAQGDTGAEETLARRLAAAFAAKLTAKAPPPPAPAGTPTSMPRETLAGFGERRVEEHKRANGRPVAPTLFGRQPDGVHGAPGTDSPPGEDQ